MSSAMKVTFPKLPETFEQFSALAQAEQLSAPENACAMFLLALHLYTKDKDAGVKAVDLLRGPRPMNNHEIQFLRDRLIDKAYLPLAYFNGATPQNNYAYTVEFTADPRPRDCEAGYMRLYLKTAGADSPRPVKLRQKDGNWYLWEYSGVLSGIRIPAAEDAWA